MTADTELLPLPMPKGDVAGGGLDWTDEEMQAYARANMVLLVAEVERLRAEREIIGAEAVRYAEKSGRLEARAERLAEALREIERVTRNAGGYVHDIAQRAMHNYDMGDE